MFEKFLKWTNKNLPYVSIIFITLLGYISMRLIINANNNFIYFQDQILNIALQFVLGLTVFLLFVSLIEKTVLFAHFKPEKRKNLEKSTVYFSNILEYNLFSYLVIFPIYARTPFWTIKHTTLATLKSIKAFFQYKKFKLAWAKGEKNSRPFYITFH
jgi:hypothetical protein